MSEPKVIRWQEMCDGEFYEVVSAKDYDELRARAEALEAELAVHKESRVNLEKWNDQLVDKNSQLRERVRELEKKADQFHEWYQNRDADLSALRAQVTGLREALEGALKLVMLPHQASPDELIRLCNLAVTLINEALEKFK